MVYFRVDANQIIATGHLMRMITIANALKKYEVESTFLIGQEDSIPILEKKQLRYISLHLQYNEIEKEQVLLNQLIRKKHIPLLMVDSYAATPPYIQSLCDNTRVFYMDDFGGEKFPATGVINYNISASESTYQQLYEHRNYYLGTTYAPLRDEFQNAPKKVIRNKVEDILITSGGTDQFQVSYELAKRILKEDPSVRLHIVSGSMNLSLDKLKELEIKEDRVTVYVNIDGMARLMAHVDLCISAGGSTLYELCSIGTPTLSFSFADNQLPGVRAFDEKNLIPYMGDVRDTYDGCEMCFERILEAIKTLKYNETKRREQSLLMQAVVDGKGADRLATLLIKNMEVPI